MEDKMTIYTILFEKIDSQHVGKALQTTATITHVEKPKTMLKNAIFTCRACMKLYTVEQKTEIIHEPKVCVYCGNKTFKLLNDISEYGDIQYLTISTEKTSKTLKVILKDEETSYDKYHVGQTVQIKGVLQSIYAKKPNFELILNSFNIQILPNKETEEIPTDTQINRQTPEYRNWHKEILNRDKVCQACGGHKHLEVHHLYSYKNYPLLRVDQGNGIVLCSFCHNKFHSYYGKEVTPADLIKFIKQFRGV